MSSEEEIIIAFIFNRSGKEKLKDVEIYLSLSMELNWFKPDEAKNFVKKSVENKLLVEEDGLLKPGFNVDSVDIPLGFKPSKTSFNFEKKQKEDDKDKEDVVKIIINKIVLKTKKEKEEIKLKIKKEETEKNITELVAALLVAKENDIDVVEFV